MENREAFLQEKAQSIRTYLERMNENHDESIIREAFADIGLDLILVKERVGKEELIAWLAREFGASKQQAEDFWKLAYFERWSKDNLELGLDEFGDPIKREHD